MNKRGQQASVPVDHGRDERTAASGRAAEGAAGGPPSAADPDGADDRALVAAARGGDRGAFQALFHRHRRRAYGAAFQIVRHQDDALDVVQDAFIKAHRNLDRFEGTATFSTWLHRIVINVAIDHLRKHRRTRPVDFSDPEVADGLDAQGDEALLPRVLGGNPARALMDRQIRERIEQALGELSEVHRTVLVLRELDGLSYEEMAEVMGCAKGTIMSRLFHARRNMQLRLRDLVDPGAAAAVGAAAEQAPADAPAAPAERGADAPGAARPRTTLATSR